MSKIFPKLFDSLTAIVLSLSIAAAPAEAVISRYKTFPQYNFQQKEVAIEVNPYLFSMCSDDPIERQTQIQYVNLVGGVGKIDILIEGAFRSDEKVE